MSIVIGYLFFVCGFFGLMVGLQSEDLKIKEVPIIFILALVWPYVLYLWIKEHYFKGE